MIFRVSIIRIISIAELKRIVLRCRSRSLRIAFGWLGCLDRAPFMSLDHDWRAEFHAHRSESRTGCGEMDTDIGTELFAGYENDFNLIIADISSKLQGLQDQEGEARKAALRAAERAIEEAEEIAPAPARAAAAVTLTS